MRAGIKKLAGWHTLRGTLAALQWVENAKQPTTGNVAAAFRSGHLLVI
jgi:hypothetical protein